MGYFLCGNDALIRRALRSHLAPRLICLLGLLLAAAVAQAQTITDVFTSPPSVIGGGKSEVVVDISEVASSNLTVNLSSNSSAAEVPATLTVQAGFDYGTVTFATEGVDSTIDATITATYGSSSGQGSLVIQPATVKSVTVSPQSGVVAGGVKGTFAVVLTGLAGPSGVKVALTSSDSAAAALPSSLEIAAKGSAGSTPITTYPVNVTVTVKLTATTGSVSQSGTLTVAAPTLVQIVLSGPTPQYGVSGSALNVALSSRAGPSGASITLTSGCPAALNLPATVVVPAGQSGTTLNFTAAAVGMNVPDVITAQYGSGTPYSTEVFPVLSGVGSAWPQTGAGIGNNSLAFPSAYNGGTMQWSYNVRAGTTPPVIGTGGALYFTDGSYLNAVSSSGTLLWAVKNQFRTTPAVGADGTIYATASNGSLRGGYLLAYDSQGREKWGLDGSSSGYYPISSLSPSIGIDGTIYVLAESTTGDALLAVTPSKTIKWTFPLPSGYAEVAGGSPLCSGDGSIYFVIRYSTTNGILMAVSKSGAEKWYYKVTNPAIASGIPVVVDPYSNVCLATGGSELVSLNTNGKVNWTYSDGSNTILSLSAGAWDGDTSATDPVGVAFTDHGTTDDFVTVSSSGALLSTEAFPSGDLVSSGFDLNDGEYATLVLQTAANVFGLFLVYDGLTALNASVSASAPITGSDGTIYQLVPGPALVAIK